VFLSGIVVLLQFVVFLFIGVQLACYYAQHPEVRIAKADEAFADFIIHVFPANTGLVGLMLAAILAAAMSTLASSLNSSASALVNDFYVPWRKTPASEEHLFSLTRWLTVFFGLVQIGVGIAAGMLFTDPNNTVVKNVLTIAGFSFGVLLGVFVLGLWVKKAGQLSALLGGAVGLMTLLAIKFVGPRLGITIAFPWLALIGSTTTLVVGWLFSFFESHQQGKKA